MCEIQLPRLTQRKVLEETEGLPARKSKLGKALGVLGGNLNDDEDDRASGSDGEGSQGSGSGRGRYMSRSPSGSRSPTPEKEQTPEYWTEGSEDEEEATVRTKKRKVIIEREGGQRSRSVSVGSDEGRYISRSPTPDEDRVEGDV